MIRLSGIKLPISHSAEDIEAKIREELGLSKRDALLIEIYKKSLDARRKGDIHYNYTVDLKLQNESCFLSRADVVKAEAYVYDIPRVSWDGSPVVVVGSGPAGLFAALVLARAGLCPVILERGRPVCERSRDVESFFKTGKLNESSNVLFGEGGAGTFSDGKLQSGIRDHRCRFILEELVKAGAPPEISYDSKPHIGTDKLREVVKNIRLEIERLGGRYYFSHTFSSFDTKDGGISGIEAEVPGGMVQIPCDRLILAAGHSARQVYSMLFARGINLAAKAFSVGVRIEHPQSDINMAQYGRDDGIIPPADYRLSVRLGNGRGVYTFCMCPGGTVVSASSEEGYLATNGMSNYLRDGKSANSALLVGVTPDDYGSKHPLSGIAFQRRLERLAFLAGGSNYRAPAQTVGDFLKNRETKRFSLEPSYLPGVTPSNLWNVLPDFAAESIASAIPQMGRKVRGFNSPDAVMTAVESRSSAPVRVLRDGLFQSNVRGLYPCGEGAGYAGGILSAAVDGMRVAEQILSEIL